MNGQSRDMQPWTYQTRKTNVRENRRDNNEWTI
jgi:hypothetical protein